MTRIDRFCDLAVEIAKDDSHGYNQAARWSPDFDCSSLVYYCAAQAGYDVPTSGTRYTGTMLQHFGDAGFRIDEFDGNLNDLERGDVLLNVEDHTALYIGNGLIVEASIDENGGISGGKPGDQTGREIHVRGVYNYPWTHVLTAPEDEVAPAPAPTGKAELVSTLEHALQIARSL